MNYKTINVENSRFQSRCCVLQNSDIITSYDPIFVEKSVMYVDHITFLAGIWHAAVTCPFWQEKKQ